MVFCIKRSHRVPHMKCGFSFYPAMSQGTPLIATSDRLDFLIELLSSILYQTIPQQAVGYPRVEALVTPCIKRSHSKLWVTPGWRLLSLHVSNNPTASCGLPQGGGSCHSMYQTIPQQAVGYPWVEALVTSCIKQSHSKLWVTHNFLCRIILR
jgi:hypothetical protein